MEEPSEEDWIAHFVDLDEVAGWSRRLGFRGAVIVVPAPTFELPDAKTRSALAARTTQVGYDPIVAVLHPNGVARGLLTMLQWMRSAAASVQRAFSNEGEALAWLEKERGEALPELITMLRATARTGTESDSAEQR